MDKVKLYKYDLDKTGFSPDLHEAFNTLCACIVYGKIDKISALDNPIDIFESCLELKDFDVPIDKLKKAIEIFKGLKLDRPIIVNKRLEGEESSEEKD